MSSDFSGFEAQRPTTTRGAYVVAGLVAAGGAAIVGLVLTGFSLFTAMFGPGHLTCPDGGDAIWHRPGVTVLLPEALVGLMLTAIVWICVALSLRSRGVSVPRAFTYGAALAGLSAGAVTFWITLSDYLALTSQPARYRCADYTGGSRSVPLWLSVALIIAFPAALAIFANRARQGRDRPEHKRATRPM